MILLLLLAFYSAVGAMDNPSPIIRRGDHISFRVMSVDEGDEEKVPVVVPAPEVFDSFFCTDEQASVYDDVSKLARVRTSLFIQLCVQASKATGSRAQQFHELLEKIKKKDFLILDEGKSELYTNLAVTDAHGKVKLHDNVTVCEERIGITHKDLYCRLLSCIPKGRTSCMINGKKVRLDMAYFETEDDKSTNQKKQEELDKLPPQKWVWGTGMEPRIACKEYSGRVLQTNYFFECDTVHHAVMMKEYQRLINPFVSEPSHATANGIPMPENLDKISSCCVS